MPRKKEKNKKITHSWYQLSTSWNGAIKIENSTSSEINIQKFIILIKDLPEISEEQEIPNYRQTPFFSIMLNTTVETVEFSANKEKGIQKTESITRVTQKGHKKTPQ